MLSLGIYGLSAGQEVSHLVSLGMPAMVLIVGLAVMIISALGIYAATSESSGLLQFYFGCMMLLLLFQVVLSSLALARQADVDAQLYDAWGRAVYQDQPLIQKIEKTLGCCGFASLHDRAIPRDCAEDEAFGFMEPCRDKLGHPVKATLQTLGFLGLVLAALQALALLMTVTLYGDVVGGGGTRGWGRTLQEHRTLLQHGEIPASQQRTQI